MGLARPGMGKTKGGQTGPALNEKGVLAHSQIDKRKSFLIFEILYSLQIHLNSIQI
jgi:hypothetical protein